jgi:hypothetical protein
VIAPLLAEVERLRAVMAQNESYLAKTESATRYAVIDPVLALLGWDVHDAATVLPEYRSGATSVTFVDYALLRDGAPVVLIEAKALGVTLADGHLEQLSNYCVNCQPQSVRWGILTNGDRWRLIDAFKVREPLPQRVVMEFGIRNGLAITALNQLVSLFGVVAGAAEHAAPTSSQPKKATDENHDTQSSSAIKPLKDLLAFNEAGGKPPIRMLFPGGSTFDITKWVSIWSSTLDWLVATGRLNGEKCPMKYSQGAQFYTVNTTPTHANGKPFTTSGKLPNGLFYERSWTSLHCIKNALHALQTLGVDPDTVRWTPLP